MHYHLRSSRGVMVSISGSCARGPQFESWSEQIKFLFKMKTQEVLDLLEGNNILNIVTPKWNIFSILSPQEKHKLKYFLICALMNVLVMSNLRGNFSNFCGFLKLS